MREFLSGLAELSLTLGAMIALLLALGPLLQRRLRPQWRYWAWLLVALRLAVPFNVSLPQAPLQLEAPTRLSAPWTAEHDGGRGTEAAARPVADGAEVVFPETAAPAEAAPSLSLTELAFTLWAAGAAGVLAVQLGRYAAFRRQLRRWRAPAGSWEGLPVETCPLLASPVLVGLLRPHILLPEGLEGEGRTYALAHEAAHARRRDLWYKLLLLWVCALYWFHPLVWLLRRAAERDLEICCDRQVLAGKDENWRRGYGAALLSFVVTRRAAPLTSQFAGGVRGLKERFRALADTAPKGRGTLALVLVLCAALLGGALAACNQTQPQSSPAAESPQAASIPDGTYWAQLPLSDYLLSADGTDALSLTLVEVDEETMTITDLTGSSISLPLAAAPELEGYGDGELSEFLMWAFLSSHYPMVLELEVAEGEIQAMAWRNAQLADPTRQDAVVRQVDLQRHTLTYAALEGEVGEDSQWIVAPVLSGQVDLEALEARIAPLSSWGLPCVLTLQSGAVVELQAGALKDGTHYIGRLSQGEDGLSAWVYELDEDTRQMVQALREVTLELSPDAALYQEDGTLWTGSREAYLEDFIQADQALREEGRRYNVIPDPYVLTLEATVGAGRITSLTRLPPPEQ